MARGKKKEENLTLEEKLEQALVPVEEWPYEVPGNWCWVRLKDVASVITGGTPSKNKTEYYGGTFPFFKPADLDCGRNMVAASEFISEKGKAVSRLIPAKSTAICCIGSIGKCGYLCVDGTTNQQINSAIPKVNSLFLYYYCNTILFTEQLRLKASATTISIVNKSKMEQCVFPLPPLREQQRIANHIEEMFYKLDEIKEKVQNVLESSENRKSAILHKAFSGELTEQWRGEHKIQIDSWVHINLKQVCEVNPKKIALQNLEDDLEVSFYPMAAISEITGKVITPQLRTLKEVKTGFTSFREGDVIFAKITPCMENGKSAVVDKLVNDIGFGSTEFYVLRCNSRLFNRYLHYIIRDRQFRDCAKEVMTGAVGQQRVPKSFLEEYLLYLPTVDEQKEVVRLLDGFIKREQEVEAKCKDLITNIDLLKKSILSRAFCGELGTNNPDEESAIELLKTIL